MPQTILYDNTKLAVAQILGDGRRKRTQAFSELQSHYLFGERFGRPGKGNDNAVFSAQVFTTYQFHCRSILYVLRPPN